MHISTQHFKTHKQKLEKKIKHLIINFKTQHFFLNSTLLILINLNPF